MICRTHLGRHLQSPPLGVSAGFQGGYAAAEGARISRLPRQHLEAVRVGARGNLVTVAAEAAVELVEDAVILVQLAQLHTSTNIFTITHHSE